jgi:hypothetical protein
MTHSNRSLRSGAFAALVKQWRGIVDDFRTALLAVA